jgi:RNA polymerase sigma-70 factor (ECF subfamily)
MTMTLSRSKSQSARREADTAELDELFQQHWERLCGALYRLVGDPAEAEDLALETFVRLYRRPPARREQMGGWLYRVATNLGYNALRARKRRQTYESRALEDGSPPDPAEEVERRQERERVRMALASLKPRQAQLLTLRHSGLAYAEIAEALGVAPASVGTLLARAEAEFERKYLELEQLGLDGGRA